MVTAISAMSSTMVQRTKAGCDIASIPLHSSLFRLLSSRSKDIGDTAGSSNIVLRRNRHAVRDSVNSPMASSEIAPPLSLNSRHASPEIPELLVAVLLHINRKSGSESTCHQWCEAKSCTRQSSEQH